MKKTFCDRCGEQAGNWIKLPVRKWLGSSQKGTEPVRKRYRMEEGTLDLCSKCDGLLREFLKLEEDGARLA